MSRPNVGTVRPRARVVAGEDRLNEAFHGFLRDAAQEREERQRVHALQDADAAKRESADLLSLARRYGAGDRSNDGTKR